MKAEALLDELRQVAAALGTAVEPPGADQLLTSIAETARRLFGARACSLALITDDRSELVYTTASGAGAEVVTRMRMPVGRGIAGWVVQSGQPVAISDVRSDPRFDPDVAQSTGYVPQSIVAAPVVSDTGVLGVLTVLDRDADRPAAQEDLQLLQVFCGQAAIALESTRAFRQIAQLLLEGLAEAAGEGSDLATALAAGAGVDDDDDDLAALAALFAQLSRQDPDARRLAVDVVSRVAAYADGRGSSRPGV